MNFHLLWPTRSRSGSQFVVKLTRSLYGAKLGKLALVNGGRRVTNEAEEAVGDFPALLREGRGVDYVRSNWIAAMKYEDPGKDDFVQELMDAYPEARAVASYRPLEEILTSHYNINMWGHAEPDILHQFSSCLQMYRRLFDHGQLFMLDVSDPSSFSLDAFCHYLGVSPTQPARSIVSEWLPTNTLAYQQEKHDGSLHGRAVPPRLNRLREIHPWIEGHEKGYLAMCNRTPHP